MAKYLIELVDPETGEAEEVDTIQTNRDWYTAEDYIFDCSKYEDEEFLDTLCAGEIKITKLKSKKKNRR